MARVQLEQSQLETVVPRHESAWVLILAGQWRGQQGRMLKKNAETQLAAVQLASDSSIQKVSFDDFAEYVGEVHDDE